VLSKHNPELREDIEEFTNEFTSIKEEYVELKSGINNDDYPIICDILGSILNSINDMIDKYEELYSINPMLHFFLAPLALTLWAISHPVFILYAIIFECGEPDSL
jgi:hypothetical protein